MERMMKVQEVILKAMAGSLKWWEAAEIIGVSDRTMRRWRERYLGGFAKPGGTYGLIPPAICTVNVALLD